MISRKQKAEYQMQADELLKSIERMEANNEDHALIACKKIKYDSLIMTINKVKRERITTIEIIK